MTREHAGEVEPAELVPFGQHHHDRRPAWPPRRDRRTASGPRRSSGTVARAVVRGRTATVGSKARTRAPRAARRWAICRLGESRRSSVLALKVRPHTPTVDAVDRPAAGRLDLGHHAGQLLLVAGDGAGQEREVVARLLGDVQQGPGVLGQARSAPARAGAQELEADALVVAQAEHDVAHVGPHLLAQAGHGVDVAQLGGQERVGGVLDGLRRGGVGDDERRPGGGEQAADQRPPPRRRRPPPRGGRGAGCRARPCPRGGTRDWRRRGCRDGR